MRLYPKLTEIHTVDVHRVKRHTQPFSSLPLSATQAVPSPRHQATQQYKHFLDTVVAEHEWHV